MSKSKIDHPDYYNPDLIESIDVIESLGPEYAKGFEMGCVIKYSMRAGKKPGEPEIDDLEKAQWYLNRYIEYLKKNENVVEKKKEGISNFKLGDRVQSIYNYKMTGQISEVSLWGRYVVQWDDGTVSKNVNGELILFNNEGRKNED